MLQVYSLIVLVMIMTGCAAGSGRAPRTETTPAAVPSTSGAPPTSTQQESKKNEPSAKTTEQTAPILRFDGLYRAPDGSAFQYLRFFEDGTVVSAGTNDSPGEVITWLKKDVGGSVTRSKGSAQGKPGGIQIGTSEWSTVFTFRGAYKLDGSTIEFSLRGDRYSGTVGQNRLRLKRNVQAKEYEFVKAP